MQEEINLTFKLETQTQTQTSQTVGKIKNNLIHSTIVFTYSNRNTIEPSIASLFHIYLPLSLVKDYVSYLYLFLCPSMFSSLSLFFPPQLPLSYCALMFANFKKPKSFFLLSSICISLSSLYHCFFCYLCSPLFSTHLYISPLLYLFVFVTLISPKNAFFDPS